MTTALPASIPSHQCKCSLAAIELARRTGVSVELRKLEALTEELFSPDYAVDVHHDPEIADFATIVFCVSFRATPEEAARRNRHWHARLVELAPRLPTLFCLSIDMLAE